MGKWWSVLFAVTMLAATGLFVVAPFVGWWLPLALSLHSPHIDHLFYVILWITGFFFVLTEALMCWFMFKYASGPGRRGSVAPGGEKARHTWPSFLEPVRKIVNDQHKLEIAWTIVPAIILLYVAFAQVDAWAEAKYKSRMPAIDGGESTPMLSAISARQWEWVIRYPNAKTWQDIKAHPEKAIGWAKGQQYDDVIVHNELHVVMGRPAVTHLTTIDVLHSFFLPQMRVKQDALPGKIIPVWFTPTAYNTDKYKDKYGQWVWQDGDGWYATGGPKNRAKVWEIACAELCGSRHGPMKGRVFVHETEEDFLEWLQAAENRQRAHKEQTVAAR